MVLHFISLYSEANGVSSKRWSRMQQKQQIATVRDVCLVGDQSFDTLIGKDTWLKAVDIALLMGRKEIYYILRKKDLRGVRCGRTIACGVG